MGDNPEDKRLSLEVDISDQDILEAMKEVQGYPDVTPGDFGAVIMLIVALLVNNIPRRRRYPEFRL